MRKIGLLRYAQSPREAADSFARVSKSLGSIRAVEVPIDSHPYFAKRTKLGKPYKRRQAKLERFRAAGIKSFLSVTWDEKGGA